MASFIESMLGDGGEVLSDTQLQLLLLTNLPPALGTALMSPLLDSLQGPYGATEATIGLLMTAYTAPSIVMIPLIGGVADRYGRKPFLIGGLILFSITGAGLAFTTDFRIALVLRLGQGIGFAATIPVIITSIGDIYSGAAEATGQGLRFGGSGLTQAIFPLIGGFLVAASWRYPLLLFTVGLPIALVVALVFKEPSHSLEGENATHSRLEYIHDLFVLASHPRVTAMLLVRALPVFIYIMYLTYVSLLVVQSLDGTPGQAGVIVAVTAGTYALVATQAGRVGESFEGRVLPLVVTQLLMGLGVATFAIAPSVLFAVPGALALGAGFGLAMSLIRSVVTGFAPTRLRGGMVSLFEAVGRVSATLSPVIVGGILGIANETIFGYETLRVVIVTVGLLGGLLAIGCLLFAYASEDVGEIKPVLE